MISQDPPAATAVVAGSAVNLVVSTGAGRADRGGPDAGGGDGGDRGGRPDGGHGDVAVERDGAGRQR